MAVFSDDKLVGFGCACARSKCSDECSTYRSFKPKPQTNADLIRGMSDEELARWIAGYVLNLTGGSFDLSEQSWLNWLKSPVEVDNG